MCYIYIYMHVYIWYVCVHVCTAICLHGVFVYVVLTLVNTPGSIFT
jgi:hypothetical protein